MYRKTGLLACIMAPALLSIGCSDPASQRVIARRESNLRHTAEDFAQLERGRTTRIANTLKDARIKNDKDVINTTQNPARIGRWIEQDCQRFSERQPAYRKEIDTQLRGKPENIKRTVPDIVW